MSFFKKSFLVEKYNKSSEHKNFSNSTDSVRKVASMQTEKTYDIFLSHSYDNIELVLGTRVYLLEQGFSVYVDWIDDPQLDRAKVSVKTANILRNRMIMCKCLIFLATKESLDSKWTPWELGYMDGKKNKVAILPALADYNNSYSGQEYLEIYPYITEEFSMSGVKLPYINEINGTRQIYLRTWFA